MWRVAAIRVGLILGLSALVVPAGFSQTKIRLHDAAADVAGYKKADLSLGPSNTTAVTNTTASGTDIQVTKTGGGSTVAWITQPFQTAVTISGTVTCNIYAGESATSANAALRCRLYKYSGGSEGSAIMTANMTTELSTSTTTVRNWTGTPSSTSFAVGDRLVIKLFLENCATSGCPTGTMAGSQTVTVGYDGTTDGSNAASWVQTNENLVLSPSPSESLTTSGSCATSICRAVGPIDTVIGSDSVTATKGSSNSASVSETLTTSASVTANTPRSVNPSESLTTTASVNALASKNVSVSVSLTTTPSCATAICRAAGPIDTVIGSDSAGAKLGKLVSVSESLTTSATGTGSTTSSKNGSVTESLSTSATCATSACRAVSIIETIIGGDAATGGHNFPVAITQNLSTQDNVVAKILSVSVSQSLTTTATVTAVRNNGGSPVETYPTTSSVTATKFASISLVESFSTADSILALFCGAIPENLVTSAGVVALAQHNMVETESLTTSATTAVSRGLNVATSATLTTSSSAATSSALHGALTETLSTADMVATSNNSPNNVNVSNSLTTTPIVTAISAQNLNINNTYTPTDSAAEKLDAVRAATENLTTSGVVSIQTIAHYSVNISESVVTVASGSSFAQISKTISESFPTVDALSAIKTQGISVTQNAPTTDAVSVSATHLLFVNVTSSLAESDSVGVVAPSFIQIGQGVSTQDLVTVTVNRAGTRRRFVIIETP